MRMNSYRDSWNDNVLQGMRAEAQTSVGFTTQLTSMSHCGLSVLSDGPLGSVES